ncbi:hypothetical protein SRM_p56033 (plasmid) [Salinibacter ruber M8]|uniref:Uncharacterized protein n=1 Tax=Salinibacter ruber (strain M8) TaxID=761659 RepID=D5H4B1_SALRM|nr:hypothetical protein SRM_p56033 [Salinibacter ruber M8]
MRNKQGSPVPPYVTRVYVRTPVLTFRHTGTNAIKHQSAVRSTSAAVSITGPTLLNTLAFFPLLWTRLAGGVCVFSTGFEKPGKPLSKTRSAGEWVPLWWGILEVSFGVVEEKLAGFPEEGSAIGPDDTPTGSRVH